MGENTRSTDRYVCDRCETAVPVRKAMITGEADDSEEVICGDCITPEDRLITNEEDRD